VVTNTEFRLRSIGRLHWASWFDEYVVFDEASGQTHQLDQVHAFVLHLLSEAPQSRQSICEAFLAVTALPSLAGIEERVPSICDEFILCGLVEAVAQ